MQVEHEPWIKIGGPFNSSSASGFDLDFGSYRAWKACNAGGRSATQPLMGRGRWDGQGHVCGSGSWLGKQKGGTAQVLSSPEAKAGRRAREAFGAENAAGVSSKQAGLRPGVRPRCVTLSPGLLTSSMTRGQRPARRSVKAGDSLGWIPGPGGVRGAPQE